MCPTQTLLTLLTDPSFYQFVPIQDQPVPPLEQSQTIPRQLNFATTAQSHLPPALNPTCSKPPAPALNPTFFSNRLHCLDASTSQNALFPTPLPSNLLHQSLICKGSPELGRTSPQADLVKSPSYDLQSNNFLYEAHLRR